MKHGVPAASITTLLAVMSVSVFLGCAPSGSTRNTSDAGQSDASVSVHPCSVAERELIFAQPQTLDGLGAIQGIAAHDDTILVYGDAETGAVREYRRADGGLVFTGRSAVLTMGGEDLIQHPTGLAFVDGTRAWIGDTVNGVGTLRLVDMTALLANGTLDDAVVHSVMDDAAVNGTRPHMVTVNGQRLLATADYGDRDNEVRLMDPSELARAAYTSDPGVVVHRFNCGAFVQNLHWLPEARSLVLVRNTSYGRGWRLALLDLDASLAGGNAVITREHLPSFSDELEGAVIDDDGRAWFVTSAATQNLYAAHLECP